MAQDKPIPRRSSKPRIKAASSKANSNQNLSELGNPSVNTI
jgi:hypothetical protein